MKQSRITTKYLRAKSITKDNEGVTSVSWGTAVAVQCEVWPSVLTESRDVEGYRLDGAMNMRLKGKYTIAREGNHESYSFSGFSVREGDGVCLNVLSSQAPDYVVKSITPYKPLLLSLEKI